MVQVKWGQSHFTVKTNEYAGKSMQQVSSSTNDTVWVEDIPGRSHAGWTEGWNWIRAHPLLFSGSDRTLLGSAVTDGHGAFQINVNETLLRDVFVDRRPTMDFKVLH